MRDAVPPCETIGGAEGAGRWPHPPPPGPPGSWVLTTRASRTADPAAPDSPNTPGDDSYSFLIALRSSRLPQHTRRRLERVITAGPASPRFVPLQPADTIVRDGAARFPALRAPPPSMTPRITPGKRVQTPPNNLPGEEDSPKQTITATFTLHASKTTPEQRSLFRGWF